MPAISRPLLILMAVTVGLMAFLVIGMRPKPVAVKDTPLAATREISKAKAAATTSDAANARVQAATGSGAAATPPAQAAPAPATPATPPAGAAPKSAAKPAPATRAAGERRDAAVVRDLKAGRIVVLLFWNPDAADDIATRGALRELDRRHGKVVVRVVPIENVAQYASVTRGVKIAQSPTTVIVGRKGRTRVIAGLTESHELAQAVGDALAGR
jgi:hypothetical protein